MNNERIILLQKFISEEPQNPFNKYALAMEYYEEAPNESLKILEALRNEYSEYLPLYFKLAHLYWDFEKWNDADEVFIKGIDLAEKQKDIKAISELKSAYQNFQFEND